MVLFAMPTAVVLSMWMGVGGGGCPSSCNMIRMTSASLALRNKAPSSASAAEAVMHFKIVHDVSTAPLSRAGLPSWGTDPKK